jgi:hypothetical protein
LEEFQGRQFNSEPETHPKEPHDFEVSNEESELARRVYQWFGRFVADWYRQFITTHPVVDAGEEALDESKGDDYTM